MQKIQSELEQVSRTDALTGLANRKWLRDLLQLSMKSAVRRREKLAVMFTDLDGFKDINDTLGHTTGDHLLREVAERLRGAVRDVDIVSRSGGDEFVIILQGIITPDDTVTVAEKILARFNRPFRYEGRNIDVGASIGISHYPDDGDDCDRLPRCADNALYQAKKAGKNRYNLYGSRS